MRFFEANPYNLAAACLCVFVDWWRVSLWLICFISIVGRFLEHSRIYIFGTQERARIYISSADFMTRNTLRRVEVAAPIEDPDIRMQIQEMFVTMLSDNRKARIMNNKGNYKIEPSDNAPLNSQEVFLQQAYDNAAPAATDK